MKKQAKRPVGRPRSDGKPHLTRAALFQVTARLVASRGYAGTSLRAIAGELGVSPASIFNLYESKAALVNALVIAGLEPAVTFYERLNQSDAEPTVRLYRSLFEDTLAVRSVELAYSSLLYMPELALPEFTQARNYRARLVGHYLTLLEEGIAAGDFECSAPGLAAEQLLQVTETVILPGSEIRSLDPRGCARATAQFGLRAVLADVAQLPAIEVAADTLNISIEWEEVFGG